MSAQYSTFEITCFINRLRSLQWFCSETDKSSPRALLFIPGPDGRNNPGSVNVLKYLFRGSVSKSLFDETLDGAFEVLEDIILMVKETSIYIIYSKPMKDLISPYIARVPHVIEYCYTAEEESDIDKFQQRKCEHFKRMILESLNPDDGVGLSVPIGYDDIMDVESWPMLQSFALDSVIAPTGFFTNRHNIADISPNLEVLFRTVDCTYVANALQLTKTTIVPHVQQLLMVMQSTIPSQRKKITADDVIGPLEVMYEFGEIESAGSLEKISPPIVFFGPHTTQIGVLQQALAKSDAWRDHCIEDHVHVVFEGCEPSSGMRFCRTYFLKHGTGDVLAKEAREVQRDVSSDGPSRTRGGGGESKSQVDDDPDFDYERSIPRSYQSQRASAAEEKKRRDDDSDNDEDHLVPGQEDLRLTGNGEDIASKAYAAVKQDIQRMQALYVKLWFALRCLAFDAFYTSNDVLEAATSVQSVLNALLFDDETEHAYPFLQRLPGKLVGEEKLQLHIDCMNALGEIVSLEDVNDLGGACWVYIRATINGIHLLSQSEPVAVAVGDTFLFSPLVHASEADMAELRRNVARQQLIPHMTDFCCATAEIPYYATMNGLGYEEDYARLVHILLRNQQLAAPLKLGRPLETQQSSSSQSRFPCLLDHVALPYVDAEIKSYSAGFLVERINRGHELPLVISFEKHVRRVWITDLADTVSVAQQRLLSPSASASAWASDATMKEITDTLIGYLITFELGNDGDERGNPLSHVFQPLSAQSAAPRYFSIVVRLRAGEVGATVLPALDMWKASFRLFDIPVHVGNKSATVALPDGTLQSLVALLDRFTGLARTGLVFASATSHQATSTSATAGGSLFAAGTATTLFAGHELALDTVELDSHEALIHHARQYLFRCGVPGIAHAAMCALHALAEVQRLSSFAFDDLLHAVDQQRLRSSRSASTVSSPNTSPNGKGAGPTTITATAASATAAAAAAAASGGAPFAPNRYCAMDVLVGGPGSGLRIVQSLFRQKLSVYYGAHVSIEFIDLDFTALARNKAGGGGGGVGVSDVSHADVVEFLSQRLQPVHRRMQENSHAKAPQRIVFFLTVTMSPLIHVKCCDLWVCLSCSVGLRVVNVTCVVSPDTLNETTTPPPSLGLGYEWWRSLTMQTLRPSSANAVLLLESSTQAPAWRSMKALLALSNPHAHLLRVHPNIPSLTGQDWEYYATRMDAFFAALQQQQQQQQQHTPETGDRAAAAQENEREAFLMSLGYPSPEQQPYLGRDLRHLDFKTLVYPRVPQCARHLRAVEYVSERPWALSSVLALLTLLFPHAKTTTFSLTPHWQSAALALAEAPPGSFQRLVHLASAKVLTQTHAQELAKRFQQDVASAMAAVATAAAVTAGGSAVRKTNHGREEKGKTGNAAAAATALQALQSGALSVVVVMTLHGETLTLGHQATTTSTSTSSSGATSRESLTEQQILIEANHAFISLREYTTPSTSTSTSTSRMMIHGVFDEEQAPTPTATATSQEALQGQGLLPALVRACHRHRLRRVSSMVAEDVTDAQRMRIQRLSHYRERPLPTGWWYDGHHFINFHGANRLLRPDIDEMVEEYCRAKNVDIAKHNRLLDALEL